MARGRRKPPARTQAAGANLLTVAEAASYLHVHPDTVRRLIARGELNRVRIGRAIRIERAALEAYVEGGGGDAQTKPALPVHLAALHARCAKLDAALGRQEGTTKKKIMAAAAEKFGRELPSANDLTVAEVYWVLDRLREAIAELPPGD